MKKLIALLISLMLVFGTATAESATASLQEMYAQAELLMVQGDYAGAAAKFEALSAYSDAAQMTLYCKAIYAADMGMYVVAVDALRGMGQFKDAPQLARYYTACSILRHAETYDPTQMVDYDKYHQSWSDTLVQSIRDPSIVIVDWDLACCYWAKEMFAELALYKDSLIKVSECDKLIQKKLEDKAAEKEKKYQEALAFENEGNYEQALEIFKSITDYKDSYSHVTACMEAIAEAQAAAALHEKYTTAVSYQEAGEYLEAYDIFTSLDDYLDSASRADECYSALTFVSAKFTYYIAAIDKTFSYPITFDCDSAGNIVYKKTHPETYPTETRYVYENGQLVSSVENGISEYSDISNRVVGSTYTKQRVYNEYGDPITEQHKEKGLDEVTTFSYTYDAHGNKTVETTSKISTNRYGKTTSSDSASYEYEYENDQVKKETRYYSNGKKLHYIKTFEYDDFGRILCEVTTYYWDILKGNYDIIEYSYE